MRNYLKKKDSNTESMTTDELIARIINRGKKHSAVIKRAAIAGSLFVLVLCLTVVLKNHKAIEESDVLVSFTGVPNAATAVKMDTISIPAGIVKANPFLPYRNIDEDSSVSGVPGFDIVAPPEEVGINSEAARIMDTIVSGILYDKHNPSAIINIEGSDYLVKKGDVVNKYKVLNITQDSVTVKLGNNTYKAGIGEILTEGTVVHNDVSNLSKKFGGEK